MIRLAGRLLRKRVPELAELAVRLAYQVRARVQYRLARSLYPTGRTAPQELSKRLYQAPVTFGVERPEHGFALFLPLLLQQGSQRSEWFPVPFYSICDPKFQPLQLYVEVAYFPECPGHPLELVPELLGPRRHGLLEDLHGGPHPAGGDPHVV